MTIPEQRDPRRKYRPTPGRAPQARRDEGFRVYDVEYLRRLRSDMRKTLAEAEQASVDWNSLDRQHKERSGGDAGKLWKDKDTDHIIKGAYDELVFKRDWTMMFAAVLAAETGALPLLGYGEWGHGQ